MLNQLLEHYLQSHIDSFASSNLHDGFHIGTHVRRGVQEQSLFVFGVIAFLNGFNIYIKMSQDLHQLKLESIASKAITSTVAANVKSAVITSSPGFQT